MFLPGIHYVSAPTLILANISLFVLTTTLGGSVKLEIMLPYLNSVPPNIPRSGRQRLETNSVQPFCYLFTNGIALVHSITALIKNMSTDIIENFLFKIDLCILVFYLTSF